MKLLLALFLCAFGLLGSEATDHRIVGGEEAIYGEHPYICSLQSYHWWYGWSHICGSVIWNNNYIVTAAHCVTSSPSSYRVVCGLHVLNTPDSHEIMTYVTSILRHPNYSGSAAGYPNDIALLELSSPLEFVDKLKALELADSETFEGDTCILSGWGRTSGTSSSMPNELQKVKMTAITNENCSSAWSDISGADINDGHICFLESGKSACNGDSGGPVRCGNTITGITSWGISTCSGDYPSVYTRVSHFHSWLVNNGGNQTFLEQ